MGATALMMALTAAQTYQQYTADREQSRYQQSMLEANARMADLKARDAIRRGDEEASAARRKTKRLIGSQRAAMAAQGINIDSGSSLDVQESSATLGALDEMTAKNNAWREAWGFRVEGADYRARAGFEALSRKNRSRNTLLTGGMQAAYFGVSGMERMKESGKSLWPSKGSGGRKVAPRNSWDLG